MKAKLAALALLFLLLFGGGYALSRYSSASGFSGIASITSISPSPAEFSSQLTITAQAVNASNGNSPVANVNITFYYYFGPTGTQLRLVPLSQPWAVTNSGGYASIYFTPSEPGLWTFCPSVAPPQTFASDFTTDYCQSVNVDQTVYADPSNSSESIVFQIMSTPTGNWNVTSAFGMQAVTMQASAVLNYGVTDLTSFDFSEGTDYAPTSPWWHLPMFVFGSNFTLQVGGYTFSDVRTYNNGIGGVGTSNQINVYTTAPNGTKYNSLISPASYPVPYAFGKPLPEGTFLRWVIMSYQNPQTGQVYDVIAWTLTPAPNDNLGVGYNPTSVWTFPAPSNNNLSINMTINMSVSQWFGGHTELLLQLNSASLSQGPETGYGFTGTTITGAPTTIGQAVNDALNGIVPTLQNFFTNTFRSWLSSLGLGWLYDSFNYLIQALLLFWNLILASFPYLGILFLILNLLYIAQLDIAGLIEFYVNIYGIVANIANFIIDFVNAIVDFIRSIIPSGAPIPLE